MTSNNKIESYTQQYIGFLRSSNYEGGLEYFMGEVIDNPTFEAVAFETRMYALCSYREHKKYVFRTSSCKETIDRAFTMYSERIHLEDNNVFTEISEGLDYLKQNFVSCHESYMEDLALERDDSLERFRMENICRTLHELMFYVGAKIEEFGANDFLKDMQLSFWKTGCELMQKYAEADYSETRYGCLQRKLYTDKIRQSDAEYPAYELPYIAKTLEEQLEICKAEKALKSGTYYSDYKEKQFVIPEGIEVMEERSFCSDTIEEVVIPKSVKKIERYGFGSCKQLKKVVIPADSELSSIGDYTFYYTSLKEIKIPKKCEIGKNALFGCDIKYISIMDKLLQKIIGAIKK